MILQIMFEIASIALTRKKEVRSPVVSYKEDVLRICFSKMQDICGKMFNFNCLVFILKMFRIGSDSS